MANNQDNPNTSKNEFAMEVPMDVVATIEALVDHYFDDELEHCRENHWNDADGQAHHVFSLLADIRNWLIGENHSVQWWLKNG